MKTLFVLSISILFSKPSLSQSLQLQYGKSLISELRQYLKNEEKLDSVSFILIEGLTSKYRYPFDNKKVILANGLYKFRSGVSHKPTYLFIKKDTAIELITDYSLKGLMELYNSAKKSITISSEYRIKLLENIVYIVIERSEMVRAE